MENNQDVLAAFLANVARIVREVPSERELNQAIERYLFGTGGIPIGPHIRLQARMGYIARIGRDFGDYKYPDFLPQSLPDDDLLKCTLDEFFTSRATPDKKYIASAQWSLYWHMFYGRSDPLEPYVTDSFAYDQYVNSELRRKVVERNIQVGTVLYSPIIGRWHRLC